VLQEAELADGLRLLNEQVFSCDPERLFNTTLVGDESLWTLKPMVELLLMHVHDVALNGMLKSDREQEIRWAIEMAGF
jgi:hypothetical protein